MDKATALEMLSKGAQAVGVSLPQGAAEKLLSFGEELMRWNRRINLTAITDPAEIIEKHFIDSLAVVPQLVEATTLLDIGSGGGFPGIPIKIALPDLDVTLVESYGRKVAFLKNVSVGLKLGDRIRAIEDRARGHPQAEKVPIAEVVISRAVQPLSQWVRLGRLYLANSGSLIAMLGSQYGATDVEAIGRENRARISLFPYRLPFSGARRAFAVFRF